MNRPLPIPLEYFSDVLCVWAYVGDVRLVELERAFPNEIAVDCHFIDVFGDAHGKLGASWAERGGLPAYGAHVRHVVERFDHVPIHADVWAKCQPTSSMGCHILLAAVKLLDPTLFRATARALREAFFAEAIDISQRAWPTQLIEVRSAGPAPPRSKPISLSASKAFWVFSVLVPWNMMSPDCPWNAIRPDPCSSQTSHNWRRMSVV